MYTTQSLSNFDALDMSSRVLLSLMVKYQSSPQIGSEFLQKMQFIYDELMRMYSSGMISASQLNKAIRIWSVSHYSPEEGFPKSVDQTVTDVVAKLVQDATQGV